MKKRVRKLQLNRETFASLTLRDFKIALGGHVTLTTQCTAEWNSCGQICP